MRAEHIAVNVAYLFEPREILLSIGYVPRKPDKVLGSAPRLVENCCDVLQSLSNLVDEVV